MELQEELRVNYCHLAVVSTDPPDITDAFRIGLGATFTFLSDYEHKAIIELDMAEIVDPDFAARNRRPLNDQPVVFTSKGERG